MFTVSGSIICKYGHAQLDLKNMLFSACTRSVVPHPTTRLIRLALPHPVASCLRCCLLPDLCGPVHSASAASFTGFSQHTDPQEAWPQARASGQHTGGRYRQGSVAWKYAHRKGILSELLVKAAQAQAVLSDESLMAEERMAEKLVKEAEAGEAPFVRSSFCIVTCIDFCICLP